MRFCRQINLASSEKLASSSEKPIHQPWPRIKEERIRIYPDSRLRGFALRHSHFLNIRVIRGRLLPLNWCLFACHAVAAYSAEALRRLDRAKVRVHLSRRSLGEGGFVVS